MKTKTLIQNLTLCILLLMGCLCYNPICAQVCTGDINLYSQADVDAFSCKLPCIGEIRHIIN